MTAGTPTKEDYEKMFDTKMNLVVTIDGVTYDNLQFLSEKTGRSKEDLGSIALFYGMDQLIQEIKEIVQGCKE